MIKIYCNVAEPKQYYFQNPGSNNALDMIYINDNIQFYLLLFIVVITYIYIYFYISFINYNVVEPYRDLNHGTWLEVIWTIIPAIILVYLAIPSIIVLYNIDLPVNCKITIKCIGSQWYWTYQYNDSTFENTLLCSYDSYMVATDQLDKGQLRLLQTDNPIIVPIKTNVRLLVTSSDVIHSFSIPSLGIKIDAVPGRLNLSYVNIFKEGTYYGSCQEICGIQHAFMPIMIKGVDNYGTFMHNILNNLM